MEIKGHASNIPQLPNVNLHTEEAKPTADKAGHSPTQDTIERETTGSLSDLFSLKNQTEPSGDNNAGNNQSPSLSQLLPGSDTLKSRFDSEDSGGQQDSTGFSTDLPGFGLGTSRDQLKGYSDPASKLTDNSRLHKGKGMVEEGEGEDEAPPLDDEVAPDGAGEDETEVDGDPEDTDPDTEVEGEPVDDASTEEDTIQVDEFIPDLDVEDVAVAGAILLAAGTIAVITLSSAAAPALAFMPAPPGTGDDDRPKNLPPIDVLKNKLGPGQLNPENSDPSSEADPVDTSAPVKSVFLKQGVNGLIGQPTRAGDDRRTGPLPTTGVGSTVNSGVIDYGPDSDQTGWSGPVHQDDPANVQFGPQGPVAGMDQTKNTEDSSQTSVNPAVLRAELSKMLTLNPTALRGVMDKALKTDQALATFDPEALRTARENLSKMDPAALRAAIEKLLNTDSTSVLRFLESQKK
jgi:hypothetical protein